MFHIALLRLVVKMLCASKLIFTFLTDHIKDESASDSSGWSGVFIFFLILLAVGVVGVVAYALIGKSQDRKRLY